MKAIAALRALVSRLHGLRHRTAAEREIAEELELHRAMLIDEGIGRGLSRDEAHREASLALGGALAIGEAVREQAGVPTADELEQAKGGLALGQWQRSLDGARAASAAFAIETVQYGSLDRLHRWPESVRAVTGEQVRTAAAQYIQPDKLVTVLIGQLDAVRNARHPRWPATMDELMRPATAVGR